MARFRVSVLYYRTFIAPLHCMIQEHLMSPNEKASLLLRTYGYLWLLYIVFGISIAILSKWYPELTNSEYKQTQIIEMAKSNPFHLLILACIFAPFVEEMMFRTLIAPSHSDLILFICSWPVFLGAGYLPEDIHWILRLAFSGVVLFSTYYILKQLIPEEVTTTIRNKLSQFVIPVLVLTAVVFGLVHISNYVTQFTFNITLVILIIPQVIAGFMLGWLKLKTKNLGWSIGLHFMNNIVPVMLIIFGNALSES